MDRGKDRTDRRVSRVVRGKDMTDRRNSGWTEEMASRAGRGEVRTNRSTSVFTAERIVFFLSQGLVLTEVRTGLGLKGLRREQYM